MNNKYILGGIVVGVLILGVVFPRGNTVVERIVREVGAVSGPDISSPYLSVNSVRSEFRSFKTGTATSTPCQIPIPIGTSTLAHFSFLVASTTGTAASFDIGTSTTPYSTTTVPFVMKGGTNALVAAGAQYSFVWNGYGTSTTGLAPTDLNGNSTNILVGTSSSPVLGSFLVVKTGSTAFIGGTCKAEFRMLAD